MNENGRFTFAEVFGVGVGFWKCIDCDFDLDLFSEQERLHKDRERRYDVRASRRHP
jgi:hypothetical protein